MNREIWSLDPTSMKVALTVVRHGPISRADMGRTLGLSSGSLTRITRPLLTSRVLVECDPAEPSSPGRPSVPLDVASDAAHFGLFTVEGVVGAGASVTG